MKKKTKKLMLLNAAQNLNENLAENKVKIKKDITKEENNVATK